MKFDNAKARESFIKQNLRLVRLIANKYKKWNDDYYQEGVVALIKAVDLYDEKKAKFSTYAYRAISSHIARECLRREHIVPLSYHDFETNQSNMLKRVVWDNGCEREFCKGEEDKIDMLSVISRLPEDKKKIVYLKFFEDREVKAIAKIVGDTPRKVSTVLSQTLHDLRTRI